MKLVGYQKRWLADQSRQKLCLKSRRIGISEVASLECATRAMGINLTTGDQHKPVPQIIVSASHPQAKKFLRRVRTHVQALGMAVDGFTITTDNAYTLGLPNGVEITAFSTNADTIRGEGGDVTLDEFASMPRPKQIWAAVRPIASPTLGNPQGYRIRIIGTPLGDDNMFYEFCRADKHKGRFSLHEISIYDAVKDGFPIDPEEEREEVGDDEMFAQEYELSFLSAAMRYIEAELYDSATYERGEAPAGRATQYAGMDVARTKHNSAIVLANLLEATLWHTSTDARKGASWDEQEAWADEYFKVGVARMSVDATSIGNQFAERMEKAFGKARVESVQFTAKVKEELFTGLKLALSTKRFRPLADDVDLRRDVLSMRRRVTDAANVLYDIPETKMGHGDRGIAAALCVRAAGGQASKQWSESSLRSRPDDGDRLVRHELPPVRRQRRPV